MRILTVKTIIQCGDYFLLSDGEDIQNKDDYDVVDLARAVFRCEVGTFRKCKSRIGKATIRKILDRQEYLCLICFDNLMTKEYHIDHLVPISLGGSNQLSNLSAMCAKCNLIKSSLVFKNETSMREYILKRRSNI